MSDESKVSENTTDKNKTEQVLQDVDKMLNEEAPGFVEGLNALKKEESLGSAELISENQTRLQISISDWKHAKGFYKFLYKIIPFIPYLSLASHIAAEKFMSFLRWNLYQFVSGAKHIYKFSQKKIIQFFKFALKKIKHFFGRIHRLSKVSKILSYLSILGLIGGFALLFISYRQGLIPKQRPLFIKSFSELGSVESYNENETEKFYDNFRIKKYIVEIPKMVVNLKRTDDESNPMLAFDLYIECSSETTSIEIKDRLFEMKDLIQRDVELMTYDQLSSTEGKNRIREKIKNALNQVLINGRIRKVLFKTFVLKPL